MLLYLHTLAYSTNSYGTMQVQPVEIMLKALTDSFDPLKAKDGFTLDLNQRGSVNSSGGGGGSSARGIVSSFSGFSSRYFGGGACLSHDHKQQFTFVQQVMYAYYCTYYNMRFVMLIALILCSIKCPTVNYYSYSY